MLHHRFPSWLLTAVLIASSCISSGCAGPQERDLDEIDGATGVEALGEEPSDLDEPAGRMEEPPPVPSKPSRPPPQPTPAEETDKPKAAAPKTPPKAAPPAPRKGAGEVAQILADLQDRDKADAASRRLWSVPKAIIPLLIEEVENPAPSQVEQIKILVVDPEFVGDSKLFLASRLRGLGKMEEVEQVAKNDLRIVSQEYTKMSYGITPNKKHYQVLIDKYGGFSVGIVIRAGLMNRFRSARYPALDDDDTRPGALIEWWRQYYKRVSADLAPP